MVKQPKTVSDIPISKTIYMNGKRLGGVQQFSLDLDVREPTTKVNLTLTIKRGSFRVVKNEDGTDDIHFDAFIEE